MKQNGKRVADQVMTAVALVFSIGAVVLSLLDLLGVWEKGVDLSIPLMGAVLLIYSIQIWKRHRGSAIVVLCASVAIFACSILALFLR